MSEERSYTSRFTIDRVAFDKTLLGAALGSDFDMATWGVALRAAFGLGLITDREREVFAQISGGRPPPIRRVREWFILAGRRSGKSRIAALVAVYYALFIPHKVARGEKPMVLVLAPSLDQAQMVFAYAQAFISESPVLLEELVSSTASEIRLKNGVVIAVHPVSFRSVRGRTLLACIFDEVAYWRSDESGTPDSEVYSAVLPSLITTRGMLVGISTPYRKIGLLHQKWRDNFGVDNPNVLVIQGPTTLFNPTIPPSEIASQRAADPSASGAEWDATFRNDLSAFLDDELIEKAIDHGRPLELPPQHGIFYRAFVDASGGTGNDSYTIAIGHKEGERFFIDLVRGTRHGVAFDPAELTLAYGQLCREYRIGTVIGDNYAAAWVSGAWSKTGVSYVKSNIPKFQIYLEALPCFTRELVSLPDHPKLLRELRLLERRVHRSRRDSIDHGRSGTDDHVNSVCGVLRTLSAYQGGYDPEVWARALGDVPDTPRQLDPKYAEYATRPLWSPYAPGCVSLGAGGYRTPTLEERALLGLDAIAVERNEGKWPSNVSWPRT
jgi:hypothetical protein